MLSDAQRLSAAHLLRNAEQDRAPIDPLTTVFPGIDVVDAYEIALINIRARLEAGETVYGHKVGLSSEVMQKMMGVDEPDYGHLLSSMVYAEGTPIDTARFCYPRIEVEIGYVLGETLPGEGCTEEDVLAATEYIVPSIELIDSRITDWKIGLADTIADNASSAGRDPRRRTGGTGERRHRRDLRRAVPGRGGDRAGRGVGGARQSHEGRGVAGPEGRELRSATRGRARHPARLVHPRDRRPAR